MKSPFTYKMLLLVMGLSFFQSPLWAQGQQIHIYLSPGSGALSHGDFTANRAIENTRGGGLQIGGSYSFLFSDAMGLGVGLEFGSYNGGLSFNGTAENTIAAGNSGYSFMEAPAGSMEATGFSLREAADIKQNFSLGSFGLVIPIFIQISEFGSANSFFINVGPKVSFLVGDGDGWTGNGTSAYSGDFSDYFTDKLAADDEFTLVVDNVPAWGFSSETLTAPSEKGALFAGSPAIGFFVSPGVAFGLGKGKPKVTLEAIVQGNLGNLKGDLDQTDQFASRREGETALPNLSAEAGRIGLNYAGLRLGVLINKGSSPPKPKPEPRPNPSRNVVEAELPVIYLQPGKSSSSENDAEFNKIMQLEKRNIRYSGTLNPDGTAANDVIRYNKADPEALRNIRPSLQKGNDALRYEGVKIEGDQVLVTLSPSADVYQRRLPILVKDEKGKSLNGFTVELTYDGETRTFEGLNSGDYLTDVWSYKVKKPTLRISRDCYNPATTVLSDGLSKYTSAGIPVTLASSGDLTQFNLPLAERTALSSNQVLNGRINLGGQVSTVDGKIVGNRIELTGGCGLDLSRPYQLTLAKVKGYDIHPVGKPGDWKAETITLPMQGNQSQDNLVISRLPEYHLMYVDISEAENRVVIIDELEAMMKEVGNRKDDLLGYLSNGGSPRTISTPADMDELLEGISYLNPQLPIAQEDLNNLKARIDKEIVDPKRKIIVLNFVLSETIYRRSRSILVRDLLNSLGEGAEDVVVRIYTEKPISEADKMDKELNLKTKVEYRQLK